MNRLLHVSENRNFILDLLWICRKLYSIDSICCGFAVESTTNPQHLDMSRCCGFVEKLWICRKAVDLLWICRKVVDLCCGFAVQLVVQQIHNKSNKWSLSCVTSIFADIAYRFCVDAIIMASARLPHKFSMDKNAVGDKPTLWPFAERRPIACAGRQFIILNEINRLHQDLNKAVTSFAELAYVNEE
jgi:hypothetical protein